MLFVVVMTMLISIEIMLMPSGCQLCIDRNNVMNTWTLPNVTACDTFVNHDHTVKSRIDYIMCSTNLEYDVREICAHKIATNASWHRPISMYLAWDPQNIDCDPIPVPNPYDIPKIAWHKVIDKHKNAYKEYLDKLLQSIRLPPAVYCQNMSCDDPSHKEQINMWCEMVNDCYIEAGRKCLPKCRKNNCNKPGWLDEVKPLKEESLLWHRLWMEDGEPDDGEIFHKMRNAKKLYFYAVRRLMRRERYLRYEKMANSVSQDSSRDFWKEVKMMKTFKSNAPHIDNIHNTKEIAEHFSKKYKRLYNENSPSIENIEQIENFIGENTHTCDHNDYIVTEEEVSKAVEYLKCGKSDGRKGIISDHIKHAPKRLHTLIAIMLTTVRRHGHMPNDLLMAIITSIPKDRGANLCSSDNYRGISLSSCLAKIHDIVILKKYGNILATSEMQYAFKVGHGTTMCTLVMKEVIKYYQQNETDVYGVCIDASKAFDRVKHDKLFLLLIKRGLPAVIIRSLYDSYKRQCLCVKWKGELSEPFRTSNGIKQGSILSPVLFTVYMDELLNNLQNSGYGCTVGKHYFGAMGYADDLSTLCPTVYGLQKMLKVCDEFGEEYGVMYNPSKSKAIIFSNKKSCEFPPEVTLSGQPVTWVNNVVHLGNKITSNLKETDEISCKRGDFIGRINNIMVTYPKAPDAVLVKLLNSQCSHFYGSEAWNQRDQSVLKFYTTWNWCVRKLLQLPLTTHTRFLALFINRTHVKDQILKRFYKMVTRMKDSSNQRLAYITRRMAISSRSIIGGNMRIMSDMYGFDINDIISCAIDSNDIKLQSCEHDIMTVATINEIMRVAEGKYFISNFNDTDISEMITDLCTN